ncbi:MAG: hypothetical protein CL908_02150 [Deltaproteobacteria bacterium]|nr:hypothetical protein [Deltaproteobacteria bacterium]
MSLVRAPWKGRPKRLSRRVAFDLRLLSPLVAVLLCYLLLATAIFSVERITPGSGPPVTAPPPMVAAR